MALSLPNIAIRDIERNGVHMFTYGDYVSAEAVTANSLVQNTDYVVIADYVLPPANPYYKVPSDPYPLLSDEIARAEAAEAVNAAGVAAPKLPRYTTVGRPSAATAGAGAMYLDTTLGKPGFSTGSAWVDATGATI